MKIYKVNINGDFKVKREININDYILWDCTGSTGITLKHKKNGKTIFLATKELFDGCKENYINQIERIGKSFSYVYDENRKKVKDEKGNPIKIYDTKEDLDSYKKYFLSKNYIQFEDFTILADLYFK
ncbi:MAG: hypothetical protein KA157_11265 [Aliarcobacter sp.]|jgi:hypothetical protein|nr:hypothetical protein [Aliarcobacter sp.]